MKKSTQLKAQAFDLIAQLEAVQMHLRQINQQIAIAVKEEEEDNAKGCPVHEEQRPNLEQSEKSA